MTAILAGMPETTPKKPPDAEQARHPAAMIIVA
jgi:hypothetical protein